MTERNRNIDRNCEECEFYDSDHLEYINGVPFEPHKPMCILCGKYISDIDSCGYEEYAKWKIISIDRTRSTLFSRN